MDEPVNRMTGEDRMASGKSIVPRRRWAVLVVTGLLALAAPAAAQAGPLVASAPDCDAQELSQPFLRWLDPASYTLNNGGAFENGAAGWSLKGGASVASGNEPFRVHGDADSNSLSLPSGSSATSSTICVGLEHPDLRFFVRNTGFILSNLKVEVLFETADGNVRSLPIGLVPGTRSWAPTLPIPLVVNLLPLLPGDRTPVAFRFTPQGGNWSIDDVYVDPYRSR
jgi:hypothetical protein